MYRKMLDEYRVEIDALPKDVFDACAGSWLLQFAKSLASRGASRSDLMRLVCDAPTVDRVLDWVSPASAERRKIEAASRHEAFQTYMNSHRLEETEPWAADACRSYMTLVFDVFGSVLGKRPPDDFPAQWRIGVRGVTGLRLRNDPTPQRVGRTQVFGLLTELIFDGTERSGLTQWQMGWCYGLRCWSSHLTCFEGPRWERFDEFGAETIQLEDLHGPLIVLARFARVLQTSEGRAWYCDCADQLESRQLLIINELERRF